MINSSDYESRNLGIDLAFNSDVHDMDFYEAVKHKLMGNFKNDRARFLLKIRDYLFLRTPRKGQLDEETVCGN